MNIVFMHKPRLRLETRNYVVMDLAAPVFTCGTRPSEIHYDGLCVMRFICQILMLVCSRQIYNLDAGLTIAGTLEVLLFG